MTDHRISITGSLHTALKLRHPDLPTTAASKATLVVTSHLIEELAAQTPGPTVLMSGFQHGRNWAVERDRYLAISGRTDVIAVFAGRDPPTAWETDHLGVRLPSGHGLAQEWFVLALGPGLAVTLCGLDADPAPDGGGARDVPPLDEGDRLFEVIWSFEPAVARSAAAIVLEAIARDAPDRLPEARERIAAVTGSAPDATAVARAADRLTSGLLGRVEVVRRREKLAERRASAAKTEFLSRIGHELRNPLNAITGYAQLLELDGGPDADTAKRISSAAAHLLGLVDEVLDMSQVESGKLRVSLEDVDVGDVVRDAAELIRVEADGRQITLDTTGAQGSGLHVRADRQLVLEVVLNLLSNAVKYDRPGGRATVTAVADGATCRIAVADTGPGIAPGDLERIFEPFERLAQTAGTATGTGLGLALSRTMATAMHGRLDVRSRAGRGATFTLALPAAGTPPDAAGGSVAA